MFGLEVLSPLRYESIQRPSACDYGHKERAGGAAVVIEHNGKVICKDVIADFHITEFFLNMISTATMIRLGRVKGNRMVDMQLSNNKLIDRGEKMIMEALGVSRDRASELLYKYKSVREAIKHENDATLS